MVREALREDTALIGALQRIGEVRAPSSLLGGVLVAVGVGAQFAPIETEIGTIWIAWTPRGVRATQRDVSSPEEFARVYEDRFGVPPVDARALPASLQRGVESLLRGRGGSAGVHFDLRGLTPFEQSVLQTALRIPRGEVRPYNWVAHHIGRPQAVRAVGTALAHNPVPFLIPCHRVIRADGQLGQYSAGGTESKREILRWEGVDAAGLERLARRGLRFTGSDTTGIFCFPTCRNARRITDKHRVHFASAREAMQAGYRPCKVCGSAAVAA